MQDMIDLHYWPTPNGHKITIFLEEAGLDYTIHPVNISAGDQFKPEFLAFSPNNRTPAIIDRDPADSGEAVTVFESGAILLYLATKIQAPRAASAEQGGPGSEANPGNDDEALRRRNVRSFTATRGWCALRTGSMRWCCSCS
jgi:Glutathione S-transferase, N-terminal domain